MRPTKKEISLSKQIAEKGVRFEPPDDWHGAYHVYHQDKTYPWADGEDKPYYKIEDFVWLPEISDCLNWLKERYEDVNLGSINNKWEIQLHDSYDKVHHPEFLEDCIGETPLEACLDAILGVLEYKQ